MQFVVSSESPVNVIDCLKDLREFLDSVAPKTGYLPFVERIRQVQQGSRTVYEKCPAGRDALFPAGGRFPTHGSQWAEADPKTLQDHRCRPNLWTDDEAPCATDHFFLPLGADRFFRWICSLRCGVACSLASSTSSAKRPCATTSCAHTSRRSMRRNCFQRSASHLPQASRRRTCGVGIGALPSGCGLGQAAATKWAKRSTDLYRRRSLPQAARAPLSRFCHSYRASLANGRGLWVGIATLGSLRSLTRSTWGFWRDRHCVVRSTAGQQPNHVVCTHEHTMYIAVSNRVSLAGSSEPVLPADHPIDKDAAEGALGMICAAGDKLGVYTASTDPTRPHTSLAPMRRHFVDIAVVVDGQQPALELEGASGFAVAITSHSVRNASTRSSWRACRCPDDRRGETVRWCGDAARQGEACLIRLQPLSTWSFDQVGAGRIVLRLWSQEVLRRVDMEYECTCNMNACVHVHT